jgi:hypothetical protein
MSAHVSPYHVRAPGASVISFLRALSTSAADLPSNGMEVSFPKSVAQPFLVNVPCFVHVIHGGVNSGCITGRHLSERVQNEEMLESARLEANTP